MKKICVIENFLSGLKILKNNSDIWHNFNFPTKILFSATIKVALKGLGHQIDLTFGYINA